MDKQTIRDAIVLTVLITLTAKITLLVWSVLFY